MSFLSYIHARRYNFGRGAKSSWAFIAVARGDSRFPDSRSWRELKDYLVESGMEDMVDAAWVVWRTYRRRGGKGEAALAAPAQGFGHRAAAPATESRKLHPPLDF